MKLEELVFNNFNVTAPFDIEHNNHQFQDKNAVQYTNSVLEAYKNYGIELHYEVQVNSLTGEVTIRLDCHTFPYAEFKNANGYEDALKERYSGKFTAEIINLRDKLKETYINIGKTAKDDYYYGKQNRANHLWLVYKIYNNIADETQLMCEIYRFIADTYSVLLDNLRQLTK